MQLLLPNIKTCLNVCLLIALILYIVNFFHKKSTVDLIPNYLHKYLECKVNKTVLSLGDLWEKVEKVNEQREVKHWQKYGPLNSETPIIVIRVHRDLERLQYLVISLAQVADIQNVLLIFSHSFYDNRINYLIQQIDFCMVMQIFYPNSLQLYPNVFPGVDSADCVNGTRDNFCEERDARVTETKQHWWWTANFVFNNLIWSPTHKDMVIFIDEDIYLLPDFLYMLRASQSSLNYVSDAVVLSFGRPLAKDLDYDKLTVDIWTPSYEKGLAFNITTWRKISELNTFYCQFDDASWSNSLMHLFEKFPRGHVIMVACMAPRAVSTGLFRSGREALENIWEMTQSQLFPQKVQAVMLFGPAGRVLSHYSAPPKGNGGWSDSRDHLLCLDLLMPTTSDDTTTTLPVFTTVL